MCEWKYRYLLVVGGDVKKQFIFLDSISLESVSTAIVKLVYVIKNMSAI